MFGLGLLLWMAELSVVIISYRSARRHKKRAEVYRKQIEELQVEKAKVMAEKLKLEKYCGKLENDAWECIAKALNRSQSPPISD